MQNKIIMQEEGFLGPFPDMVKREIPNFLSFLHLTPDHSGCAMPQEDCQSDKHLGNTILIQLKALELILQLWENGVHDSGFTGKSL
jgi:hypothetical protein